MHFNDEEAFKVQGVLDYVRDLHVRDREAWSRTLIQVSYSKAGFFECMGRVNTTDIGYKECNANLPSFCNGFCDYLERSKAMAEEPEILNEVNSRYTVHYCNL